jgi:hypothetical protein
VRTGLTDLRWSDSEVTPSPESADDLLLLHTRGVAMENLTTSDEPAGQGLMEGRKHHRDPSRFVRNGVKS